MPPTTTSQIFHPLHPTKVTHHRRRRRALFFLLSCWAFPLALAAKQPRRPDSPHWSNGTRRCAVPPIVNLDGKETGGKLHSTPRANRIVSSCVSHKQSSVDENLVNEKRQTVHCTPSSLWFSERIIITVLVSSLLNLSFGSNSAEVVNKTSASAEFRSPESLMRCFPPIRHRIRNAQ